MAFLSAAIVGETLADMQMAEQRNNEASENYKLDDAVNRVEIDL